MVCLEAYRANQYLGKPYKLQLRLIHCIIMERLKSLFSLLLKLWDCSDHGQNGHVKVVKGKMQRKMRMQTTLFILPEVTASECHHSESWDQHQDSQIGGEGKHILPPCVAAIEAISL